jgi:hypothetical protein
VHRTTDIWRQCSSCRRRCQHGLCILLYGNDMACNSSQKDNHGRFNVTGDVVGVARARSAVFIESNPSWGGE